MDNEREMIILTLNENLINELYEKLIDSSVKNSNKLNDRICGNVATGYNYDVLSCASCRIFFYRNQNQRLMMDIVKEDDIILICDNKNEMLSVEDLLIIENIRSSFVLIFQDHHIQCSCVDICQGLSMNENESSLKDSLIVNQFQSYYIELFWKYLINKQGEKIKTWKCFTHLITIIIRIQSVGKIIREFFRIQSIASDVIDQIEPLMHTLLLIQ
ncbi:unnamed protein product [Adineta steineri]|nr:unnamed protein product [Adineta steineri]